MLKIMKSIPVIFILICLNLGLASRMEAQDQGVDLPQEGTDHVYIPPLTVVIDSAMSTNAMVRFRDLGIIGKKSNLTSYKNYWTRNIGLQADVRYGTFNNFSTSTAEGQTTSMYATNVDQTVYGIGVYVKFPLQDIVDRKNQINMANAELEQARSMAEGQRDELRQEVIKQYNDVILKKRILTIKSRNFSDSKVNMDMVEKQFRNGVVTVTEYARISDIVADIEAEYEAAKTDFITSFMILEEMAGFKFN
jgi:outer membrane protein TolC